MKFKEKFIMTLFSVLSYISYIVVHPLQDTLNIIGLKILPIRTKCI